MDIPNGAIILNNDEETKESSNYGVPHQVENLPAEVSTWEDEKFIQKHP